MSILYHLWIMQMLIWCLARVMMVTMRVSGAEAMAIAANLFVGQTEAPLVVKPYIAKMTMSELNAMMTGGFATVAGSVLVVYLSYLGPEIGSHLLTASLLSAPAAFVIAKIILPETETPSTAGHVELKVKRDAHNLIEAAANGTQSGLKLYLNVIAMLLAFTALVKLIDWPLGAIAIEPWGIHAGEVSLAWIMGLVLAPLAWCIGVESWHDCRIFGGLVGLKLATNEFVAFGEMLNVVAAMPVSETSSAVIEAAVQEVEAASGAVSGVVSGAASGAASGATSGGVSGVASGVVSEAASGGGGDASGGRGFNSSRSAKMAAYALCGFANFASIGIQIGGISPLAPERKTDLSRLAVRAMLGGALASACTAAVAGMFLR